MITIDIDSAPVAKAIKNLLESLGSHGARLSDRLAIVCRRGDLSIRLAGTGPPEKVIIGLPAKCLVPVDHFSLSLSGDTIQIHDHNPELPPARPEIMERVVEVWNLTGKVAQHRYSTPASLRRTHAQICDQTKEEGFRRA